MADKYVLRVTAGPDYSPKSQVEVGVNTPQPLRVSSKLGEFELNVRIQNFKGLPRGSPATSPYFSTPPHSTQGDQYSIAIRFRLKTPEGEGSGEAEGVSAADLQFGNDFDHAIRDKLPPGFGTALSIVKWWIDPGLDGDAYADEPYLYGPALSSFNAVRVGAGDVPVDDERGGLWVEEGAGDEAGAQLREGLGAPPGGRERMKWALAADVKEKWIWEFEREYAVDFFNPYLDFSELALRLPGFTLPIARFLSDKDLQPLR